VLSTSLLVLGGTYANASDKTRRKRKLVHVSSVSLWMVLEKIDACGMRNTKCGKVNFLQGESLPRSVFTGKERARYSVRSNNEDAAHGADGSNRFSLVVPCLRELSKEFDRCFSLINDSFHDGFLFSYVA
jgi:hypothetical protein